MAKKEKRNLRILVVEDSVDDADILIAELQKHYNITEWERVKVRDELSLALRTHHWDVVVLDYYLPGFDGIEALTLIRAFDDFLPVIVVSGVLTEDLAIEIMGLGANNYVMKTNLLRLAVTIKDEIAKSRLKKKAIELEMGLIESNELYKDLFYHIPFPLYRADARGKFIAVNDAMVKLFGFNNETELSNTPIPALYKKPEDRIGLLKMMADRKEIRNHFLHLRKNDDSDIYAELTIKAHFNKSGKLIYQEGAIKDITKEYLSQKELKKNELRLKQIINSLLVGVVVIDYDTMEIIEANPMAMDITALGNDEIIGRKCYDTFCQLDKVECPFLHGATEHYFHEVKITKPDGSEAFYSKSSVLLEIQGKKRILTSFADITEQKEILSELQSAKEKAELSDKLKTAFLNNLSHEVRTPMNGIMGASQILSWGDISQDEQKEYHKMIQINGDKLLKLIDDMMDLSLLESGYMKIQNEEFEVNAYLEEIFKKFSDNPKYKDNKPIEFKLNLKKTGHPLIINNDKERFEQLFSYLLDNAFKFTKEGSISMGYQLNDKWARFYVKDTGLGISPEDQKHIFDRFRQVDFTSKRVHDGTGIGLSICKKMVELMGGSIDVNSVPGQGSEFCFYLSRD